MAESTIDTSFIEGAHLIGTSPFTRSVLPDANWDFNDSAFGDYCGGTKFFGINKSLTEITVDTLDSADVGLDIAGGSNGVALRELLGSGALAKGLVTNYEDLRDESTKRDERLDHIDGNILVPETWEEIIGWQQRNAPRGLGLILHRPYGGLQNLPRTVYEGSAHTLVEMLRPNGVFFTQIPDSLSGNNRRMICRSLQSRNDVSRVSMSLSQQRPYRHALIIKSSI